MRPTDEIEAQGGESGPTFVSAQRGDRLAPPRGHARYQTLRRLGETVRELIDSEHVRPGDSVLDFGCADRPYESLLLGKFKRYIGADLTGNPSAELIIGDNGKLPLPGGAVDAVISTQVLEHVTDPAAYLAEAHRVLGEGGTLLLSTHGIWVYHPDPHDLWRWTAEGLCRQIESAGFRVEAQRGVLGLGATSIQLWQDATSHRIPGFLGRIYRGTLQRIIGWIEGRRDRSDCDNAAIYVVAARRVSSPPSGS